MDLELHILYHRRPEIEVAHIQTSFQVTELLDKVEAYDSPFPNFSVRLVIAFFLLSSRKPVYTNGKIF